MSKRPLQSVNTTKNAKKLREDPNIRKTPPAPPKQTSSILYESDDSDEEDLYLCSQMVEEKESMKTRNNNNADITIAGGYTQFHQLNPSSSTQNQFGLGNPSSQKENNQKNFAKPADPPKSATNRTAVGPVDLDKLNKELKDKNIQLSGEAATLRSRNEELSKEISNLRRKLLAETEMSNQLVRAEQSKHKREIKSLKDQMSFNNLNQSVAGFRCNATGRNEFRQLRAYPTGLAGNSSNRTLNIPRDFFDLEQPPESKYDFDVSKIDLVQHQARTARIQSEVTQTGIITRLLQREMFDHVSEMIKDIEKDFSRFNISYYLTLSQKDRMKKIVNSMAVSVLRPIPINEQFSITKSGKLFNDELFHVPRRMIALIAILCRSSPELAKRLLSENINGRDKTIVDIMIEILQYKIIASDRFFMCEGFVMSVTSLLSSLSIHANSSNNLQLFGLFQKVLHCKFDNPYVVMNCCEFMYEFLTQSKDVNVIKPLLCCLGKFESRANCLKAFRLIYFASGGCSIRLFMMYLLTSFKQSRPLNKVETEYLRRTTLFLNKFSIKLLELDASAFIDLNSREKICHCWHNLINAIVMLSCMSISRGPLGSEFSIISNFFILF